ncbi:DUF3887 domain-containing protein [Streptomyces roseochromogenus]|uniref:DUF3887 domain-containing protein n=1 Tax=Streptomyces roseochromogenus subsp. oscitans DS 12.976 TaxID=1352936 RepID=V6JXV8_STRRC|nr:DUF3887 domain-containing protein [Streptomyces roseochromogenus]EST24760.1 hypothetical protein M878_30000 [Streptomyces roseochromogenus subsp. oscitans DS 12.976]
MSHNGIARGGKRRLTRAVGTVALAVSALLPAQGSALAASQDDTIALQTLDDIVKGDYTAATAHFDATVRRQLPPDALKKAWRNYEAQFGDYRSHQNPKDVAFGQFTVVSVPLRMAHGPGEFRVSFDRAGAIAGLFFLKPGT